MRAWSSFLLLIALSAFADYPAIRSQVTAIQVTPRVYYVQVQPGVASAANEGYNSNAGFVVTGEGVVVIDALGTPALGKALREAIRKVTAQPVKRVILTHYHADHFYGLEPFKEEGAGVWAQRAALEYLDSGEAQRRLAQAAQEPRGPDHEPVGEERLVVVLLVEEVGVDVVAAAHHLAADDGPAALVGPEVRGAGHDEEQQRGASEQDPGAFEGIEQGAGGPWAGRSARVVGHHFCGICISALALRSPVTSSIVRRPNWRFTRPPSALVGAKGTSFENQFVIVLLRPSGYASTVVTRVQS